MTVTRTGASASPRAAYNPPKPPPTMTTLGRPAVLRTPSVVLSEVITIASPIKYDGPYRAMEARRRVPCRLPDDFVHFSVGSEFGIENSTLVRSVEKSDQCSIPNSYQKIARASPGAVKVNFSVFERRVST